MRLVAHGRGSVTAARERRNRLPSGHHVFGRDLRDRPRRPPPQITARLKKVAPKAVRGRRLAPGMVRRRTMRQPQLVGGREEMWTIGFLLDVILTRDPWMHRIDITRATGAATC
jgi:hypothetical protein